MGKKGRKEGVGGGKKRGRHKEKEGGWIGGEV